MRFSIVLGLIALVAITCATPHGASSYANIHQISHGHGHGGDYGNHDGGHHDHDYHHHIPNYKYEYGVKDHHTGDHKSQWESRHGDHVKGAYTLKESDGTMRVVEYEADGHNGFNAHVKRIGHAAHPQHYGHGHDHGHKSYGHGSWGGY